MNFLHNVHLALTPLSPIHIGCGEDFEPTNYVIDDGILYGFDPARAHLPENLGKRLGELGDKADLLGIQRFFREHSAHFTPFADTLIPVAKGLAADYQRQVGQVANRESNGNRVFNQLFIERASHTNGQPYIPGSSFKGVLRTGWLDKLNNGRLPLSSEKGTRPNTCDSGKIEKRLLKGDFATSPLRLIKPSDLMPTSDVARQVFYAVRRKKFRVLDENGNERESGAPYTRNECIQPGQYRAFTGSLTLQNLGEHHNSETTPSLRLTELSQLVKDVNDYHLPRLREGLRILDQRGLLDPAWKKAIETLLTAEIEPLLKTGRAMLIRLGRYGGAESKTLYGEGVAQIKIMEGKGPDNRMRYSYQNHTKTEQLAAETSNDRKHLLPFGWALVEIDPQDELPQLRAWCEQQATTRPDMSAIHQRFAAEKAAAANRAAEQRAERETAAAAEQARQAGEAERAERLQAMSPNLQTVEAFIADCEKRKAQLVGSGKDKPNTAYHAKANALAKQAHEEAEWSAEEKIAAADAIETWLPQIVAVDAKEIRKKLKLAALHGQN